MSVGFVGIGTMGSAIALNLLRAGAPLVVWNRSPEKCAPLLAGGATRAGSIDAVCAACAIVFVMLLDEAAIDAVFERGSPAFARRLRGRVLVNLGTTSPDYSRHLERDLLDAGARYAEAPVSGSRGPAERRELVCMVSARDDATLDAVVPLLASSCRRVFRCGAVPGALRTKLAVNHYLIASIAALAEAVQVARHAGVDIALLRDVLDAGPMASDVSRAKLDKLVRGDDAPQAAIRDVATIAALAAAQAARCGARAPLIDACDGLYRRALERGDGARDMVAIASAFDPAPAVPARTGGVRPLSENDRFPVAIAATEVAARNGTNYPPPLAARVRGRTKRRLGDAFGLRNFGVNLVVLAPGAASSLRHAHRRQDEFVYVLDGHPTLRTDAGDTPLASGDCAGFRAGSGDGHCLVNATDAAVAYLEVGDRTPGDAVRYPDDDLLAIDEGGSWRFTRRDGTPY